MHPHSHDGRRVVLRLVLIGAVIFSGGSLACGDEMTVPAELQVSLLDRVLRYEHAFASHEGQVANVLVVHRERQAESQRTSAQLAAALTAIGRLAGRPIVVTRHAYRDPTALRTESARVSASLVYLAAGLGPDVPAIVVGLPRPEVLLVSAVGADADRGAVLAFELVSSRPRVVVNVREGDAQQLRFGAQFLRLARVVR